MDGHTHWPTQTLPERDPGEPFTDGVSKVRYALKTPYRDGTTHEIFKPLGFIAKASSAATGPLPKDRKESA